LNTLSARVTQLESEAIHLIQSTGYAVADYLDPESTAWAALRLRLQEGVMAAEAGGCRPRIAIARGQTPDAWKAREKRTPQEKAAKVLYLARRFALLLVFEPGTPPKRYVAGFAICRERNAVALIRKARPAWQAGKLNAVGGKIEPVETPAEAMRREFEEETTAEISDWREFCCLHFRGGRVHFFSAFVSGNVLAALLGSEEEPIEVHSIDDLATLPVIPNVRWLLPMAMDKDLLVGDVHEISRWSQE
jgi:8-oxo-dGTP diphosphatase